jgi:pimeloyl-ACP methyl ester carboxylesterase
MRIAVIRQQSSGSHLGSLIVNPGGPGGSGVEFVAAAASAFAELTDHYDLVGFDPRGVGESRPIRCLSAADLDTYIDADPDPTTAAGKARLVALTKHFADACYAHNGSYLEHVGTKDAARDMDVLRAALGDSKLTYYGASYGTYLGAKYAELFPTRIRAMVLDGAVNPAESTTQEAIVQAQGFQTDLGDFLAACVKSGSCPLGSTTQQADAEYEALKAQVAAHPETAKGRELGAGLFLEGVAGGLYTPLDWTALWQALGGVKADNPTELIAFADSQTERSSNGTFSNLIESNLAIDCIDRPSPTSLGAYEKAAVAAAEKSPDFGAANVYAGLPCAYWRVPPVESAHAVHAKGAPPILVIGTTRDPATPYVWARALAAQLDSGVLLTYNGDGHTAYLRHDNCIDSAVRSYVETLATPPVHATCG